MSTLDKKYTIRLDIKNNFFNAIPIFSISDNETSDFNIRITNANRMINLHDVIVVIVAINPAGEMYSDFVEVESGEEGLLYCNLKQSFKNIAGIWNARLMLIYENEKVVTGTFSYKVNTDEFVTLNELALTDDRFPVLTDLISRLSSIEIQESNRQLAETNRVEAEKQREIVKQQLIVDTNLKVDTNLDEQNKKVDNSLLENSNKVTKLVNDTNAKIDTYKTEKDLAIEQDLGLYKINTTQDIQLYKNNKDTQINQDLESYKNNTTANLETYKSFKNTEINQYKNEKDLQIDTYVSTKNAEIDSYKNAKDTLINAKLEEVVTAETSRVQAETLRQTQHTERQTFLNGFETRFNAAETTNTTQNNRLTSIENTNITQNGRLDNVEITTTTHGTRLEKVEYQNKVQDTFIGGLFNENGDKRLSIEGGGNELKLEGGSEGLAQVEKIVGNTAVNYATGGDRQLTLNGDIDVAGTFVSTTEGVKGGLVDVVCEGQTLNNIMTDYKIESLLEYFFPNDNEDVAKVSMIKPNSIYTLIYKARYQQDGDVGNVLIHMTDNLDESISTNQSLTNSYSKYVFKFTTPSIISHFVLRSNGHYFYIKDCILLEGDWTNKEIPQYFEGMKSVGQDDTNGHGIELVSQNKNLIKELDTFSGVVSGVGVSHEGDVITLNGTSTNGGDFNYTPFQYEITLKKNTTYTLKFHELSGDSNYKEFAYKLITYNGENRWLSASNGIAIINTGTDIQKISRIRLHINNAGVMFNNWKVKVQLEENTVATTYTPYAQNSLSIPLSEPLRGLPNGVKDGFVKKEGKWYVERNYGKVVLNGSENGWEGMYIKVDSDSMKTLGFYTTINFINRNKGYDELNYVINNKFIVQLHTKQFDTSQLLDSEFLSTTADGRIAIRLLKTKLSSLDITGFKQWLSQNPTTVIYQLATPTYEPLNLSSELTTYLEQTHISNNSLIPCNMVVKNTGFNALIKPSTLYTVITDTTGTGTLGVNLGGTKLTTSINKLTITTPATLTENMVRLYGKGITGSNVRLLEGDCTNLNYPYFEGLRSTFDNVLVIQEMVAAGTEKAENLGKYKCNVKVRGKNLFDNKFEYGLINSLTGENSTVQNDRFRSINYTKVNNGVTYKFSTSVNVHEYDINKKYIKSLSSVTSFTCDFNGYIRIHGACTLNADLTKLNIQLEEGTVATQYEPYYERTQNVYLTSPLLKGDEIVIKNDGLYHYHKMGKVVLDGNRAFSEWGTPTGNFIGFNTNISDIKTGRGTVICDKLQSVDGKVDVDNIYFVNNVLYLVISRSKLLSQNAQGFKTWLQANPTTVVYELATPTYEKIADYPITLETIPTSTLLLESLIPCTTLKASYTGSVPSVYALESSVDNIESQNVDIVATTWDVDYRLCEVEWVLEDAGIVGINLASTFNMKGVSTMALSRYEQAKIMIIGGAYEKETLTRQLTRYLEKGLVTQEEYNELIALMEAKDLVVGE